MEPEAKPKNLRDFIYGTWLGNFIVLIVVLSFVYILIYSAQGSDFSSDSADPDDSYGEALDMYDDCSVAGIELRGTLLTYIPEHAEGDPYFEYYDATASEDIDWLIANANEIENVKAILLEVDSGGGSPVAGEEIAKAVQESGKPVIAFIRDVGASAAYWAVSGADKIFASKNSDVGSIGVTMSYLNEVELNKKEGYTYEQLSAGKYKDAGSVDKLLTAEERAIFLRDINIIYENFVATVAENRRLSPEQVRAFADGSTVLGERAKELGLIDEIGGISEVEKYLEEILGAKPEICW